MLKITNSICIQIAVQQVSVIHTRLHIILQRVEIPFLLNGGNCVLCEYTPHIFLSSMVLRAFNNHKIGNRHFQNYLRII